MDATEAEQYIHDLDGDLDEDTFDFDDIRHAIDYNDLTDELGQSYREPSAIIDDLPMGYFDEDEDEEGDDTRDSDYHMSGQYPESSASLPSHVSSESSDPSDLSEEVLHKRLTGEFTYNFLVSKQHESFTDLTATGDLPGAFELAMGLWCIESGVSRTQYKSLRDILRMVPHDTVRTLPETLQTLQRRTKGHMPILPMRKQPVKLAPHKLSTETAERRIENQQNEHNDNIPRADLYFFDMKELFRVILQSDMTQKMYSDMMEWKDKAEAIELWHSMSWGSSDKTTSGHFAHNLKGNPIFVSDFVEFRCNKHGCRCRHSNSASPGDVHFGRVRCVGINQIKGSRRNGKFMI